MLALTSTSLGARLRATSPSPDRWEGHNILCLKPDAVGQHRPDPGYWRPSGISVDTRTPEQRSRIMAAVHTKDTSPEILVRKLVHSLGYRYRLHAPGLRGRPDLVFPGRQKVIFVHGCFWHGHGCSKGQLPKSRLEYWAPKIAENKKRDRRTLVSLRYSGWETLVIWQCQTRRLETVRARVRGFLGPARVRKPKTTKRRPT
jgi:DNA mismatch endonuclease (patch repair protein)